MFLQAHAHMVLVPEPYSPQHRCVQNMLALKLHLRGELLFLQIKNTMMTMMRMMRMMKISPPITPPAIAPALEPPLTVGPIVGVVV